MADFTDMQEHVLPYLQSFCSLEEKESGTSEKPVIVSKSEMESEKTFRIRYSLKKAAHNFVCSRIYIKRCLFPHWHIYYYYVLQPETVGKEST